MQTEGTAQPEGNSYIYKVDYIVLTSAEKVDELINEIKDVTKIDCNKVDDYPGDRWTIERKENEKTDLAGRCTSIIDKIETHKSLVVRSVKIKTLFVRVRTPLVFKFILPKTASPYPNSIGDVEYDCWVEFWESLSKCSVRANCCRLSGLYVHYNDDTFTLLMEFQEQKILQTIKSADIWDFLIENRTLDDEVKLKLIRKFDELNIPLPKVNEVDSLL
jgi:hypothetical protein